MRDDSAPRPTLSAAGLTVVAMLAFAANSLLCRMALRDAHIDAASFGAVRVVAGAVMLAVVLHGLRLRARARAAGAGAASPGQAGGTQRPVGGDTPSPPQRSGDTPTATPRGTDASLHGATGPGTHAGLYALTARGAAADARGSSAPRTEPGGSGATIPGTEARWHVPQVPLAEAGDWWAAWMLFAYVACFSFAYLMLPAGTGALILFAAVQLTMFGAGLARGERFARPGWAGLALAAAGLLYLLLPGAAAPALAPSLLMAAAGAAWGGYSLRGRGVPDPLAATAANFARAAPLAILLALLYVLQADLASPFPASASPAAPDGLHADSRGIALAVISGALTSGLGYVVWYAVLRRLTSLQAASVQLSVPVLAALGGVLLLGETLTPRLLLAALAILGGIGLVLSRRATGR